jgi:hypothetical protein
MRVAPVPKDWKDISVDEMLNFQGPQTAEIERYRRILEHRSTLAMNDLSDRLKGVMQQMHRSTGQFSDKADEFKRTVQDSAAQISTKADDLRRSYERIADAQGRQQLATLILSCVVAGATMLYTYITWQDVKAARDGNAIQAQVLDMERKATSVPKK